MDWFLYDNGLRHERVKLIKKFYIESLGHDTYEVKNSSIVEMFSGSLMIGIANFVKIICIELDILTWLMINPFIASVLILVIAGSFHI